MKLIMVPDWVEKALERESLDLNAVLDPEKLLSTLSREDVAFYFWINSHLERWVPQEVVETFSSTLPSFREITTKEEREEFDLSQFSDIQLALNIAEKRRVKENHPLDSSELFGALSSKVHYSEVSFRTRLLGKDTVVLVPKKVKPNTPMNMVNELLFCLNTRLSFPSLAQTPLFNYFVSRI